MLVMRQDMALPEKELWCGETLAILAAMITRMENLSSAGHVYIPVRTSSLISFHVSPFH